MPLKTLVLLTSLLLAVSGCARDLSSDTYTESGSSGKVLEGTVISMRPVKIKAHDKLSDNTLGATTGGIGGVAVGNGIGDGNGTLAADVGGAVVGAIAGVYIQDALNTSEGTEYVVKLDAKHAHKAGSPKSKKQIKESGKASVGTDLKMSIDTDLETDMVSVVQKADPVIKNGSRVYVVYHDDRPRLVPLQ